MKGSEDFLPIIFSRTGRTAVRSFLLIFDGVVNFLMIIVCAVDLMMVSGPEPVEKQLSTHPVMRRRKRL